MMIKKRKKLSSLQLIRYAGQLCSALLLIFALISENFGVMIVLLATALLGGAFYCGWFCPLGTTQEWLGYVGRKLRCKRFKVPARIESRLMFLRYILFIAGLIGFSAMAFISYLSEPYISFMSILKGQTTYLSIFAIACLAFFLFISLFIDRPFCRYFCTHGARFGLLSLGRLLSIRRIGDTCINCKLCDQACPTQVIVSNKHHVRHFQCINCLKCISACPVAGTLSYGWSIPRLKGIFHKKHKKNTIIRGDNNE